MLVVELVLPKSVGFSRYGRFGVFGLHGHFDPIVVFFLEMTYPPIFKCCDSNDVKNPRNMGLWFNFAKNMELYQVLTNLCSYD
jgi:hypothetical protein